MKPDELKSAEKEKILAELFSEISAFVMKITEKDKNATISAHNIKTWASLTNDEDSLACAEVVVNFTVIVSRTKEELK